MKRHNWTWVLCMALLAGAPAVVQAYDVYENGVPDVVKPIPADNSCWLGAAADVLGAANWGDSMTIYNTMMAHFRDNQNVVMPGWSSVAINWWLINDGLNPNSPDYQPNLANPYTDVTIWNRRLTNTDYDNLLGELNNNQYVNVAFATGASIGHEMTLVGGNWSSVHNPAGAPQLSVWHDNQGDIGPPIGPDDEHNNIWANGNFPGSAWNLDYKNDGNPLHYYDASGATILCPGKVKPKAAMDSFDVAWYTDMDANGNLYPTFRSAGSNYGLYLDPNGSTNPSWVTEANSANNPKLLLPNQAQQNQRKQIYMTVDYIDRGHSGDPSIKILDPNGTSYSPTSIGWDATGGQVLLYWDLPSQPAYEDVVFPNSDYCNLYNIKLVGSTSTVKDWDVATYCPEPAALTLLALAALALRRRR